MGFSVSGQRFRCQVHLCQPLDWYLSVEPGRDVIENPIVDEIDLNGWDLRKALGLLLKSNVIVSEWLESPIRYRQDDPVTSHLRSLADRLFDPHGAIRHYASLGAKSAERWLEGGAEVPIKKYFYSLRPALVVRVLRLNGGRRPPMNLQQLLAMSDLPSHLPPQIDNLVALKALTNEKSNSGRFPELDAFIRTELDFGARYRAQRSSRDKLGEADDFFRRVVKG